MNTIKQKRISADINRCLCQIINKESKDELLKDITITGCDVTNDLSFCYVYFTALDDSNTKLLEKELNDDTSSFLRTELSKKIDLRHTPKLVFKYDNSIKYGDNIERIIKEIHEN
jgi:ribosome-binding factor A